MKRVLTLFILVSACFTFSCFANQKYIIDTDIGGDIDDALALWLAIHGKNKPMAITTTHTEPLQKAKIAKLILTENGFPNIPVYAGVGVTRNDSDLSFLKQNPLWPPSYGYPHSQTFKKQWYVLQGKAYIKAYGEKFDKMMIEKTYAPQFIVDIARKFTPKNKLIIISLGPMHNIAAALSIDSSIKNNIVIYAMGGEYPDGYNWLINPEVTYQVLSQVEVYCITHKFIKDNKLYISKKELQEINSKSKTKIAKTIIADWNNARQAGLTNSVKTYLYDPVTLFVALNPEYLVSYENYQILFPSLDQKGHLKSYFLNKWYSMPGLNNLILIKRHDQASHIHFVTKIGSSNKIKNEIIRYLQ
jgi:purine nucleosidase